MSATNPYCEALGIQEPRLEQARNRRDANTYALLLVALLERGQPMTLAEVARRFEAAGVARAGRALASLAKCRPGRPPIYRDGDRYALDPYDDDADLWAFRLGLRPPKATSLRVVRPAPGPVPSPDERLSIAHLDEAWREGVPNTWSAQRIAVCVLDANGSAMTPNEVLIFVRARSRWSRLSKESAKYFRRRSAVRVRDDGSWELDPAHDAVRSARRAVRQRIEVIRRWAHQRPDTAVLAANRRHFQRRRAAHAEQLAQMRRVLIHAFPAKRPEAVALLDEGRREITTFVGEQIREVKQRLCAYDFVAAVGVRALLRALDFDVGARRLGELGPPQKTKTLNRRGRKLQITTGLLVQGSCGIGRPFGDAKVLRGYLRDGKLPRLRRRLEADVKSLFALYQYGRLHGAVRLRWGFLDEPIPAPWVHRDELTLYGLMARAHDRALLLEVVVGNAPGWAAPWSRAQRATVRKEPGGWRWWLVDPDGFAIDPADVQLARLAEPHGTRGSAAAVL